MEVGEEESSADQLNSRKAREEGERKEKEKKNKNKKRRLGSIEQRTEDGDAHNCSVGEAGDDGNVEGKFKDNKEKNKKSRKVGYPGGEKDSVGFDRIGLEEDRMEKRKKKHIVNRQHNDKTGVYVGGHRADRDSEKMEPKEEPERHGETNKKFKNKEKTKKSHKAHKNRGENEHELGEHTCITKETSENKGGKHKKKKLGGKNLYFPEDNQVIEEQLDIFSSEVTNRKPDTQNGKRKRESRCSNMNGGEACVGQSKCNDRKPLASDDAGHLRYDFEVEGQSTSKKREKKQKRATIMKNSSEGNNQKKTGNDVSTVETTEETPSKVASKRVAFADTVEVFPLENNEQVNVSGRRYTKEEDELLKQAIYDYIESNRLGENGVEKLLNCSKHKLRGCWKEIAKSLPWRDRLSVYQHGKMLLTKGGGERIGWTPEDLDLIVQYHKEHGSKWSTLAKALGRYRYDVKDMFRKVSSGPLNKGKWAPEELDALYNLVNKDLRSRSIYERKTHQGQFRDNIAWTAISEQMGTRDFSACCIKWYRITSPMVSQKLWDDSDDYQLVDALAKLDPSSFMEVDWDSLLNHRSGDICIRRWKELIRTVDRHYAKSFMELVEILSQRYSWDVLEAREGRDLGSEEAPNEGAEEEASL
ncbi:hypothetical protein MLD38_005597 [Melastoma candidum]|uniref:Uncharacterized protein n=1 Tax=Melastoma candidum TaxID=119954 RepID=A0ACB9RNU6_9MYRT|nr:hypothetical protein MLD38_005597 [Melastoma candidum]